MVSDKLEPTTRMVFPVSVNVVLLPALQERISGTPRAMERAGTIPMLWPNMVEVFVVH